MATKTLSPSRRQRKQKTWTRQKRGILSGAFFQELVTQFTGCIPTANTDECADAYHPTLGFNVEVKSGDNNRALLVNLDQKTRYQQELRKVRPEARLLYGLCTYRNRGRMPPDYPIVERRGKMGSLTANIHNEPELYSFLTEKIDGVYIIDVRVISHLIEILGSSEKTQEGQQEDTNLGICKRDFSIFSGSSEAVLHELGLSPRRWVYTCKEAFVRLPFKFGSPLVQFPLITILRNDWNDVIQREIHMRTRDDELPF